MPAMSCSCFSPPSPRLTSPPSHSSPDFSGEWQHAVRLSIAVIAVAITMRLALAPAVIAFQALFSELKIVDGPINFDGERIQLTIAYRRIHQSQTTSVV